MKGSTLFLGFTLVVLAGVLSLLWQAFAPRSAPPKLPPARPPVAEAPTPAEPVEPGVRSVYPGPRPSAGRPSQAEGEASPAPMPRTAPADHAARDFAPPAPAESVPAPSALVPPAAIPAGPEPEDESASAPAGDGVDLNNAPVEALNALGAGMIGRTIIANRPYAVPEDLLARRILNRRDYETIRPHVMVR